MSYTMSSRYIVLDHIHELECANFHRLIHKRFHHLNGKHAHMAGANQDPSSVAPGLLLGIPDLHGHELIGIEFESKVPLKTRNGI